MLRLLEREFPRPIHAIDWFARTFEEALTREFDASPTLRQHFAALRHQVQEISFLATDLLRIGRVRSGEFTFADQSVNLERVTMEAADQAVDRNRILVRTSQEELIVRGDASAIGTPSRA